MRPDAWEFIVTYGNKTSAADIAQTGGVPADTGAPHQLHRPRQPRYGRSAAAERTQALAHAIWHAAVRLLHCVRGSHGASGLVGRPLRSQECSRFRRRHLVGRHVVDRLRQWLRFTARSEAPVGTGRVAHHARNIKAHPRRGGQRSHRHRQRRCRVWISDWARDRHFCRRLADGACRLASGIRAVWCPVSALASALGSCPD